MIERKSSNANCASRRATLQRGADYVPLILTKKSRLVIITLLKQRLPLKPNCGTLVSYPIHLQPQLPKEGGPGGVAGKSPAHSSGPPAGGSPAHGRKVFDLLHIRFNKKTGKYVKRHLQSVSNMDIAVKLDPDQYTLLRRVYGMSELDANTVYAQTLFPARNAAAIADTGASVDCSGIEILKMLGIGRRLPLPTTNINDVSGQRNCC